MKLTLAQKRKVREAAGNTGRGHQYPVKVKLGSWEPPRLLGQSWHYRTRTGRRIWHPSAYSRKGWSNMIYHRSTLQIVVGDNWLAEYAS